MELEIESIGGMFPVQAYGKLDGEDLYMRYRHDEATLYVGGNNALEETRLYAEIINYTGDVDRGWLSDEEARELLDKLISMLRPVEEYRSTGNQRLFATVEAMLEASKKKK